MDKLFSSPELSEAGDEEEQGILGNPKHPRKSPCERTGCQGGSLGFSVMENILSMSSKESTPS